MSRTTSKAIRVVSLSIASIVLCLLLVVTGSYALFTDEVSIKNHLRAGTLEATLHRTSLTTTKLNTDGYLETKQEQMEGKDKPVDFTDSSAINIFGLTQTETIVPGTELTAKMQVGNDGDVAFVYWLEIKQTAIDEKTPSDEELAKQLEITVTTDKGDTTKYVNQGLLIGSETSPIGTVDVDGVGTFSVTVKFIDDAEANVAFDNDDAQGKQIAFDLIVYAMQATTGA